MGIAIRNYRTGALWSKSSTENGGVYYYKGSTGVYTLYAQTCSETVTVRESWRVFRGEKDPNFRKELEEGMLAMVEFLKGWNRASYFFNRIGIKYIIK